MFSWPSNSCTWRILAPPFSRCVANECTNVFGDTFSLKDYVQVGTYIQDEYSSGFNYADILMPVMFDTRANALANATNFTNISALGESIYQDRPILPGEQTSQVIALVLTMPTTADNHANYDANKEGVVAPSLNLGITFNATQLPHEADSFDNQYDADAKPVNQFEIRTNEDLDKAMTLGGEGKVLNDIEEVYAELAAGKALALNLNGMTLSGTDDNYVIVNNGELTVTGDGTITSNLHGSIENWGSLVINDLSLNVAGSKYGFHCKDGEVVINDIDLKAQRGGLNVQGGKVTINSGKITTTSYSTKIGYLVYAASNSTAEVVINGGDFRYEPGYYRHGVLYAGQNATIVVNDGTFGKGGSNTKTKWITEADGGDVIIYGGSFEFDPSEFVAEGYEAVQDTDGWWNVSKQV